MRFGLVWALSLIFSDCIHAKKLDVMDDHIQEHYKDRNQAPLKNNVNDGKNISSRLLPKDNDSKGHDEKPIHIIIQNKKGGGITSSKGKISKHLSIKKKPGIFHPQTVSIVTLGPQAGGSTGPANNNQKKIAQKIQTMYPFVNKDPIKESDTEVHDDN